LTEWAISPGARPHEFVLYAPQALDVSFETQRFATRLVGGGGGTAWEQRKLPSVMAHDHLDAFFGPGYTTPLFTRTPTVVAIHDVSFAAHPEWFGAREGLRRRLMTRKAARAATAVTTLSEFSKRELMDLLGVPERKIHVIRPGVTAPGTLPKAPATSEARPPRVLYVGSIFNRRHLPDLIAAFGRVVRHHPDVRLDLVGDNRTHPRLNLAATIARLHLNDCVTWHHYVSDAELDALYRSARAFAFLSEYEGLGLTPLEALTAGVPPLLLDTPIARESCGDAAVYAPKGDVDAIASALERLLFDEGMRQRLLAHAQGVLSRYDWVAAAQDTLAVLEAAP
jgi:glycosyltransferase involved in cell wall biosynthesis